SSGVRLDHLLHARHGCSFKCHLGRMVCAGRHSPTPRACVLMLSKRPSILLVGDTLAIGGTERQFTEIACGLARAGWDVRITCLRAEGPFRDYLKQSGIEPWSCGSGSLKSARIARDILKLARYIRRQRIDLVHSFDFYSNVYGVLAGRLAHTPVVLASQRNL